MIKIYKFYQYNENNCRIVVSKSDYIPTTQDKKEKHYVSQTGNTESEICSLSRAKRMIREYCLCNDFTYFFTSTINSNLADRYSLSECQKKIRRCMKTIKQKNNAFKYLFITEKHKDGAFHFHGLCSNLDLYINANGYYSSKDFDRLGFNSFSKIRDKTKVSNYITKYITKECVKNEAGSIYFCSRGLKRATSYDIIPIDLDIPKVKYWENEYIKICDFNINELTKEQNLYFLRNIKEKNSFFKEFLEEIKK